MGVKRHNKEVVIASRQVIGKGRKEEGKSMDLIAGSKVYISISHIQASYKASNYIYVPLRMSCHISALKVLEHYNPCIYPTVHILYIKVR